MSYSMLACAKCKAPLPDAAANAHAPSACPSCGMPFIMLVFPALHRVLEPGRAGESVIMDGESTCFYHEGKKAEVACDSCGRFLCGLCDIELDGKHLCSNCISTGRRKGKLRRLEHSAIRYDKLALAVALWPLFLIGCFPLQVALLFTAPATIFLLYRYRNETYVVSRWHTARRWAAAALAVLQILAFVGAAIFVTVGFSSGFLN